MEEQRCNPSLRDPETQVVDPSISRVYDQDKDLQKISSPHLEQDRSFGLFNSDSGSDDDSSVDSMLCLAGSRLVPAGFKHTSCPEDLVMFVNCGGGSLHSTVLGMHFLGDFGFQGGDVLRTEESIIGGGDYPSIYQCARFGSFSYQFDNLAPGVYFVDLHFAEIVNTNGPHGIRVFDVFVQEVKVLSELDIYFCVGANKPLQLVDARVSVGKEGGLFIRFAGINGSPAVSGICIRRAPKLSAPWTKSEYLVCNNCSSEIEVCSNQNSLRSIKSSVKYEKKIEELMKQYQLKTDECYEAWMSVTATNSELEKLKMELDKQLFQTDLLDQALEGQTAKLRDVSNMYDCNKKFWVNAINNLEKKIQTMKQDHMQLSQEAHECASSIPDLNKMAYAVKALVEQCEDLKLKYSFEQAERKKLYNQVQDAKGNIRVFCRCRPLSKDEASSGSVMIVDFDSSKDGDLGIISNGSAKKTFKFDRVFSPKDNQFDVFSDALPLVTSVLDGYNVCIFAYGQTGTGKTFTMEGTENNRGVNYRTLEELFRIAEERKETFVYGISVSVLEVYNEQIRDLLATSPTTKKLEIRQEAEGVHHVPGLVEAKVGNIKEAWNVLQAGSNARAVGSNNVNEHSSRSHCMLCIMVRAKNLMNGGCTKSKLWLVDLAGSERLAKTDVQGERLKEAQNINRSLSALGDVISALATKSSHIPYRNSKLTHLLQDSLGGDSKTLMFVQISPAEQDLGETLSSLNFATRVRGVELGPAKKQIDTGEIQKLKLMLEKARQESRSKDESWRKLEENYQNLEIKLRGKDQHCRNYQEKVKELEAQLDSKSDLQSQYERQNLNLVEKLKGREEMFMALQEKVKDLENKLKEQKQHNEYILQEKVKELENKIKEQKQQAEFTLQEKVKELENKIKEQKQHRESMLSTGDVNFKSTPIEGKTSFIDDSISEVDSNILLNSNSTNRPMNQGSVLLRGIDSLHEKRRKREIRSVDSENRFTVPSLVDKKPFPVELNRLRQIDASKALGRLTRTSNAGTQKPFAAGRVNRDVIGGIKERDKIRGWSR